MSIALFSTCLQMVFVVFIEVLLSCRKNEVYIVIILKQTFSDSTLTRTAGYPFTFF